MKKLILILTMFSGIWVSAQERRPHRQHMHRGELTTEQVATLQTKKLALALDLTESQQKTIQKIKFEQAELRESKRKEMKEKRESGSEKQFSSEERYERELERLEAQIAFKAKMKEVLNPAQYEKWERMQMHKKKQGHAKRHRHHRMGR